MWNYNKPKRPCRYVPVGLPYYRPSSRYSGSQTPSGEILLKQRVDGDMQENAKTMRIFSEELQMEFRISVAGTQRTTLNGILSFRQTWLYPDNLFGEAGQHLPQK